MMSEPASIPVRPSASQVEDLRPAASQLSGPARRAFQSAMAWKYCEGNARLAERDFGWGRDTVALGLAEKHTGLVCAGAQSGFGGNWRWEERYPDAALDCKATVALGNTSRGGKTCGDTRANDHDMGAKEKYIPCGLVDEDSGQLYIELGSSAKTSDFIVDGLEPWWSQRSPAAQRAIPAIQLKVDNGPESSGIRTQCLQRRVDWVNRIGKPLQLLYYPPYHSQYNPIERCWGIWEQHWNGAQLTDVKTMLAWAQSMTWKGQPPTIALNTSTYQKGMALNKKEMAPIEERLERNPVLPKWDILIRPA